MPYNHTVFKSCFKELQSALSSLESVYPLDYQRVDQKTLPVISELDHFAGCKVAELGSNFGMYSLMMSPIAEQVIGLELDRRIMDVSKAAARFFEGKGYSFDNVRFVNTSASAIVDQDYDALLLTLVLYHLNDEEIDILMRDAREKCKKVIIQCRPARIIKVKSGSLKSHVSRTTRFNGLCDIASNISFLQEIGMTKISVTVSADMLGNEVFPVLVAER